MFYVLIALGVIGLVAGAFMRVGFKLLLHSSDFHGKAYAVLAVGAVLLIAGIVGMFMGKSGTKAA